MSNIKQVIINNGDYINIVQIGGDEANGYTSKLRTFNSDCTIEFLDMTFKTVFKTVYKPMFNQKLNRYQSRDIDVQHVVNNREHNETLNTSTRIKESIRQELLFNSQLDCQTLLANNVDKIHELQIHTPYDFDAFCVGLKQPTKVHSTNTVNNSHAIELLFTGSQMKSWMFNDSPKTIANNLEDWLHEYSIKGAVDAIANSVENASGDFIKQDATSNNRNHLIVSRKFVNSVGITKTIFKMTAAKNNNNSIMLLPDNEASELCCIKPIERYWGTLTGQICTISSGMGDNYNNIKFNNSCYYNDIIVKNSVSDVYNQCFKHTALSSLHFSHEEVQIYNAWKELYKFYDDCMFNQNFITTLAQYFFATIQEHTLIENL